MRRIAARLLVAIGLGLVALGRKIDSKPTPPARVVTLPRRSYQVKNSPPSRGEVYRLGLAILFRSVAFATLGM